MSDSKVTSLELVGNNALAIINDLTQLYHCNHKTRYLQQFLGITLSAKILHKCRYNTIYQHVGQLYYLTTLYLHVTRMPENPNVVPHSFGIVLDRIFGLFMVGSCLLRKLQKPTRAPESPTQNTALYAATEPVQDPGIRLCLQLGIYLCLNRSGRPWQTLWKLY